jgi:hypothetical protein
MRKFFVAAIAGLMVSQAAASITVDGTVDASYGAPLAVQTVKTDFGDATDPAGFGNGGELNAAYGKVWNGRLYVMVTGNVEKNFNKLHLFIDSKAGGENVLSGLPNYDGGRSQNFGGLTFDTQFAADYHVFGRWGGGNFEVDVVDRAGGTCTTNCGGDFGQGAGGAIQSGSILGSGGGTTSFLSSAATFGFNNTNIAGVTGGTNALSVAEQAAAAAVTTGFEFSIALADIGNPAIGSTILVHAAYGNGDNNYHSNQFLGGLPGPQGNLGGDGGGGFTGNLAGINFNQYGGSQFFRIAVTDEVIPEPATLVMAGLAVLGLVGLRRRAA